MAETIFVYRSESDPELQSRIFTAPMKIHADAGAELYIDKLSLRVRMDDYFGPLEQVMILLHLHLPNWTEKVIIKSRPNDRLFFSAAGYCEEAFVRGYYFGIDMHFMTAYPNPNRKKGASRTNQIAVDTSQSFDRFTFTNQSVPDIHTATSGDAEDLARFYATIFPVYPTPITDPQYLKKMISGDSLYKFIRREGAIVSAACAEINRTYRNAELSDCGTLKDMAGKGFMKAILSAFMKDLQEEGIHALYSIARSESVSMNAVLKNLGFDYTGTLIQNVCIFSGFEDMNVWSFVTQDN